MPVPGLMCSRRIFSGSLAATSSMSMPPAALAMTTGRRRRAIDQDAEIELALDLEPFLDQHAADLLAFGAGLVGDQRHPDHLLRELLDLVERPGDLDAAALAAAAGVNLRLDDATCVAAEPAGDLGGFGRRERHLAARHGDAEAREHGLGLILVDFHRRVVRKPKTATDRSRRLDERQAATEALGYNPRVSASRVSLDKEKA